MADNIPTVSAQRSKEISERVLRFLKAKEALRAAQKAEFESREVLSNFLKDWKLPTTFAVHGYKFTIKGFSGYEVETEPLVILTIPPEEHQ